jgi:putative transposase
VDGADRPQRDPGGLGTFINAAMFCMIATRNSARRFESALADGGVKTIRLPAKSPNLNAFAERLVRSVKQECLSKLILFGEGALSRTLAELSAHYHGERNHQGKDNKLLFPDAGDKPKERGHAVECRHRLGGLLKYYGRAA